MTALCSRASPPLAAVHACGSQLRWPLFPRVPRPAPPRSSGGGFRAHAALCVLLFPESPHYPVRACRPPPPLRVLAEALRAALVPRAPLSSAVVAVAAVASLS